MKPEHAVITPGRKEPDQRWCTSFGTRQACRHLVKDRMDITGARWGLAGAEAVLRIRTVISNGDFEEYWKYHAQREHLRVHAVGYRDSLALAA
jgi:hypothetical protein